MVEVRYENVTKRYENGFEAVKDLNLEINDGEFLVLLGPSGCGKSTTLRMLAGLEDVSEGHIQIDGALVNDLPPGARGLGMVFQSYALYPHMTVFENMAFGLKLQNLDELEINRRVKEASEILMIEDYLDRKPKALSGGQRQRIGIARALYHNPSVLVLDEATSSLDTATESGFMEAVSSLKGDKTLIIIAHRLSTVEHCDYLYKIEGGRIVEKGRPSLLLSKIS